MYRFEVLGAHRIPRENCLVVANHVAWFDTAFVVGAMPRHPAVFTMARRDTVFNRGWKRWLLPRLCVFPVSRAQERGELDTDAVGRVLEILGAGGHVLVFPEGTYGRGGRLKPLKKGVGHLALASERPILPVALSGPTRLFSLGARVRVVIGRPWRPRPNPLPELRHRVEEVVDGVRRRLGGLLAFSRRGAAAATPLPHTRSP